jgi:hypothetical protein
MVKTGKEALKELKDYYHSPRDVELLSIIERDLDTLGDLIAAMKAKDTSEKSVSCEGCAEQFRYGVPCPDIDKDCPYKK